jgi:DNA-binding response OmpR family regulator
MLSTLGTEEYRTAGLELGADDYMAKPFSLAVLISRIRAVLWGKDRLIHDHELERHVNTLRGKLGDDSVNPMIIGPSASGYVLLNLAS